MMYFMTVLCNGLLKNTTYLGKKRLEKDNIYGAVKCCDYKNTVDLQLLSFGLWPFGRGAKTTVSK